MNKFVKNISECYYLVQIEYCLDKDYLEKIGEENCPCLARRLVQRKKGGVGKSDLGLNASCLQNLHSLEHTGMCFRRVAVKIYGLLRVYKEHNVGLD